ncbi:MAG: hypothetical protein IJG43_10625 [Acidaminococcaceae bacterium]|nr:hypothetical protein [Acidaminococcaceae bacterium]
MNKKGLIVLLLIFVLMFILNTFTPLLSDDYFSAFIWPRRVHLNDVSYEAVKRISSIEDIVSGLRGYYNTWGGRVPGGFPVSFFLWQGKEYFNPINAFMMTALVAEIYWLSHEGKVSVDFNPSYLIWIFFALWAFNVSFLDTCLWLAGSSNYLWMLVIVLAFLIPYIRSYFDANAFNNHNTKLATGIFFSGLLAGWSHETTNCWIVLMLLYLLYESWKKGELRLWKVSGFTGFWLGYALLAFAPGNFSRLQMQQNTDSVVIASELLSAKILELVTILFFHFFIWYFIVSFVFKYKKQKEKFIHKDTGLYLVMAGLFILIACGSGLMMFFIPSRGLRPSFLNLVYLIIATALLFRLQEVNGVYVINDRGKAFLKCIGYAYLIVTIFFSVWGNYINYNHLQNILVSVKEAAKQSPKMVLEVPPSLTSQNDIWLFGSGFHLVPLPISKDENYEINKTFSYYYGIKGIKIVK